jgi:hypothetical protein
MSITDGRERPRNARIVDRIFRKPNWDRAIARTPPLEWTSRLPNEGEKGSATNPSLACVLGRRGDVPTGDPDLRVLRRSIIFMATQMANPKPPAASPEAKPVSQDDLQKLPMAEVEKRLGSSPDGLTEAEAKRRLVQYGPNEIA